MRFSIRHVLSLVATLRRDDCGQSYAARSYSSSVYERRKRPSLGQQPTVIRPFTIVDRIWLITEAFIAQAFIALKTCESSNICNEFDSSSMFYGL